MTDLILNKKNLVIALIILLFVFLDASFFRNYNENIVYKYNVIERYNINSDLARDIRHKVLRFKNKTSDGLNSSISFLHFRNKNILAIAVHLNTMPNPHAANIELNFKDFSLVFKNFNCYLIDKNTDIPKFLKLIKDSKVSCGEKEEFLINREHLIFNEYRNSANNFFYVTNNQLKRIRENINLIDSYSVNLDNKKVEYYLNKSEKSMLTEFFNVI